MIKDKCQICENYKSKVVVPDIYDNYCEEEQKEFFNSGTNCKKYKKSYLNIFFITIIVITLLYSIFIFCKDIVF